MIELATSLIPDIPEASSPESSAMPSPLRGKQVHQPNATKRIPSLQESYQKEEFNFRIPHLKDLGPKLFEKEDWANRRNFIICTANVEEKAVVAERAIAQLLETKQPCKIIYCTSLVSSAQQKFMDLKRIFPKFSVRAFFSNQGGSDFTKGHIAVCTFEKAHTIINMAMKYDQIDQFKLVILDEINMFENPERGAAVEALIAKLQLVQNPPQVIGLTPTLNNEDLSIYEKWMNCSVFQNDNRQSIINQYVVSPNGSLSKIRTGAPIQKLETISQDKNYFLPLIADTFSREKSKKKILIFVNSRKYTRQFADFIASNLDGPSFSSKIKAPTQEIMEARELLIQKIASISHPRPPDPKLISCLEKGVAFYDAGLLIEERKLIEDAFMEEIINIVVATTPLSEEIKVDSVIIQNVFRETTSGKTPLSFFDYSQWISRVDKNGPINGKVFILQHTHENSEIQLICDLSQYKCNRASGHLLEPVEFDRYLLQCFAFFNGDKALQFPEHAFEAQREGFSNDEIKNLIQDSKQRLIEKELLSQNNQVTLLGEAIASADFKIDDGITVYKELFNAQKKFCLSDDLHLLYLLIPSNIYYPTPSYQFKMWDKLKNVNHRVRTEFFQISDDVYQQRLALSSINKRKNGDEIDKKLDKFYFANIVFDLINEIPISQIQDEYGLDRGLIQSLRKNVSTYAEQVEKFCEIHQFFHLQNIIHSFKPRLDHEAKAELLPLLHLSACNKSFARQFFNHGIRNPKDLTKYKPDNLEKMMKADMEELDLTSINLPFTQTPKGIAANLPTDEMILKYVIQRIYKQAKDENSSIEDMENMSAPSNDTTDNTNPPGFEVKP